MQYFTCEIIKKVLENKTITEDDLVLLEKLSCEEKLLQLFTSWCSIYDVK